MFCKMFHILFRHGFSDISGWHVYYFIMCHVFSVIGSCGLLIGSFSNQTVLLQNATHAAVMHWECVCQGLRWKRWHLDSKISKGSICNGPSPMSLRIMTWNDVGTRWLVTLLFLTRGIIIPDNKGSIDWLDHIAALHLTLLLILNKFKPREFGNILDSLMEIFQTGS